MTLRTSIETITPEAARVLLAAQASRQHTRANRPMKPNRVAQYAADMAAGRWKDGTQIVLCEGELIDGQHRLSACVQADTPITVVVLHTDDPTMYRVIDGGVQRTNGDVLHAEGIKHYNGAAAAARIVLTYEDYHAITNSSRLSVATARQVVVAEVTNNADLYHDAYLLSRRNTSFLTSSLAAFCVLLSRRADDWRDWVEGAVTGANLELGDPRLAAAQWSMKFRKSPSLVHLSVLIRARNAHVESRQMAKAVSWQQGKNNPFPTFVEHMKEN